MFRSIYISPFGPVRSRPPSWVLWRRKVTMPHKPLKPCRFPGCPNLTSETYCEEHAKKVASDYNKNARSPDFNKRYGRRWETIRNQYAIAHPLCEMCLKEGKYTPMTEVHHIVPIDCGGTNSWDNLQSLCHSCHEKIHHQLGTK